MINTELSSRALNILDHLGLKGIPPQFVCSEILNGNLSMARIPNLGKKTYSELCKWAGVNFQPRRKLPLDIKLALDVLNSSHWIFTTTGGLIVTVGEPEIKSRET